MDWDQIKIIFKPNSVRSGCPISRAKGSCNKRARFQIELEFRNVGFKERGKPEYPEKNSLGAEKRTNNKLDPHETPSPRIEPRVTLVGGECSHHYTIPAPPLPPPQKKKTSNSTESATSVLATFQRYCKKPNNQG